MFPSVPKDFIKSPWMISCTFLFSVSTFMLMTSTAVCLGYCILHHSPKLPQTQLNSLSPFLWHFIISWSGPILKSVPKCLLIPYSLLHLSAPITKDPFSPSSRSLNFHILKYKKVPRKWNVSLLSASTGNQLFKARPFPLVDSLITSLCLSSFPLRV